MLAYSIIPARGGSKGLPRKNIVKLCGKPLLAYTIEASRAASFVSRTFVSTEDAEIAEVAKVFDSEVLQRPSELSTDTATSNDVIRQSCEALEKKGEVPDIIVFLQVTDLFRRRGIIDECVQALIEDPRADAAFAVCPVHKNFWIRAEAGFSRLGPLHDLPRQLKPAILREDTGIACATRFHIAKMHGRFGVSNVPVIHEDEYSFIDIHDTEDLWLAEQVVQRYAGTGRYDF
jgi:CMP-N-acetylneuraminic acid synthetase